ncbi:motility associated factor glycosyltransferase family protein [Paenibacillus sp. SGZ-1009]|uniref:motility associated factor glycosyltransferase family protein n=1 Tax=Paenibacillus campi TaxID=3106031 RepID=UPI002AFECC2E|nr:6-hydroxymethylpterin diphosphokinase MptE-like protein [Paenibacillus sp. SGZ-1009]
MSILQANIDFLARKFPDVIQALTNVEFDASSVYTERVEKDQDWLEAVQGSIEDFKLIFMYGFGQGLAVIDLLEQYPDRWVFLYEPNISVFYNAIQQYNLVELFQHPSFKGIAIGEDQLKKLFSSISGYMQYDLAFVAHRHYLEHGVKQLYDLKEEFVKYNETFEVNQQTMDHFRVQWMRNSLYQLGSVMTSPLIESLRNALRGCTAVVIGSGPSLQQDIEWLKKLKSHALIIAAGSSIQALNKHGIQPHLTVVMDGGEVNDAIFSEPETLTAPMLITSTAYYGLSEKKQSQRMYSVLRNDFVSHFFMGASKEQFLLEPTSTVTGTAMQAAICLGASKIIMMGQDLSFPNNQFYADGIIHAYTKYLEEKIAEAAENQWLVENVEGSQNITNRSFLFMKNGLEELIAAFPNVQFINATRQGAQIAGSIFMPVEEVLELIQSEQMAPHTIEQLLQQQLEQPSHLSTPVKAVQQKLQAVAQDFEVVHVELRNLKKLLDKVQGLSRSKPLKAQQTLEEIEKSWTLIVNRDWFEPIMECINPMELSQFDKQLPAIITEKNIMTKSSLIYLHLGKLVNTMMDTLKELHDIFQHSLQRLENINMN